MENYSDLRVLYLEDETLVALDGELTLGQIGFKDIVSAASLKQVKRAGDEHFDLAILDIHLGSNVTSFELARDLIADGTAVVFLTGYNAKELPGEFHAYPVVQKPMNREDLEAALAQVLGDNTSAPSGGTSDATAAVR
ncbi:response regulator [Parvularcula sp. ZS-1/3]|uniref:Response regulator n=1 Tax=Parvularcula mediterranea TaxID=2732508 RepID=A0A7Y3W4Y1_9PROT|nr:response regulator [Parvularcula mediterranea]NNU16235.1 response regulator [Parvularcula mediterranea]